ncbi:DHS-like NAD/FAD-binding domain-containing protein, partial [Crassisporium funariophilum]
MTVFLPLDPTSAVPAMPTFLVPPVNPVAQLSRAIQAIMKAKRIVVVCGAGISVQAGIPDFRSSDGLFKSIKRDNPREAMSSGKELFDASVFNSENTTSLFCQMIAQLSDLSQAAQPTSFHHLLRALDDRGRLLRVYTQNIDAIEQKCGLSFGVPEFEGKRYKPRSKTKPKAPDDDAPVASTSRLPSPPAEIPRCIPLHGTLQSMHCQICNHSFPLLGYLPSLVSGQPPSCPECTALETTRQLVGKRPRGIGKLRPSVVLYNEAHKDGEGVGEVVQKDLIGSSKGKGRSGADLLLVVGTSLRVPGTKRMVREFAKAVRSRGVSSPSKDGETSTSTSGPTTPAPSPRRSPTADEEPIPKAVYLNLDFPVPTREWEGVFDAWIQGDAQQFAEILQVEIEKEAKAKEVAVEKKRKRDEEAAL